MSDSLDILRSRLAFDGNRYNAALTELSASDSHGVILAYFDAMATENYPRANAARDILATRPDSMVARAFTREIGY